MDWAIVIISVLCTIYFFYFGYIMVAGSARRREPISKAAPAKRIAALIPARNEALVVPNLIDSLQRQNYPTDLYDVYVIVNNCTDDTEAVSRRAGAKVIVCDAVVHSKGEVLRFAFDRLMNGPVHYDGFVVFDADNIAGPGFIKASNDALCAGYQAGQGYRDSKNPDDSWCAGCTSVFFWFMNRLFNHPRAALEMSAPFNGTGILFSRELIGRIGYNTTSLTEDLELTAQCALADARIAWMEGAVTYDEQPITLRDSFVQRRRWAAGMRQLWRYVPDLYKKAFRGKNRICLDVAIHFTGWIIQLISLIPGVLTVIKLAMDIIKNPAVGWWAALGMGIAALVLSFLGGVAFVLLVCILDHKMSRGRIKTALTMGFFLITWLPANVIGYLAKPPKWIAIPHVSDVSIDGCEKQKEKAVPLRQKETETF